MTHRAKSTQYPNPHRLFEFKFNDMQEMFSSKLFHCLTLTMFFFWANLEGHKVLEERCFGFSIIITFLKSKLHRLHWTEYKNSYGFIKQILHYRFYNWSLHWQTWKHPNIGRCNLLQEAPFHNHRRWLHWPLHFWSYGQHLSSSRLRIWSASREGKKSKIRVK